MRSVSVIRLIYTAAVIFISANGLYANHILTFTPSNTSLNSASNTPKSTFSVFSNAIGDILPTSYKLPAPSQNLPEKKDTKHSFFSNIGFETRNLISYRLNVINENLESSDYLKLLYPFHHFW